jgi:AraC-like DNA-binding protein
MTPHAFQLLCRLRLARSMLREDTAGATAAVSAGFADQSHMHKVFKRHHGMTPGEFKNSSFKLEL